MEKTPKGRHHKYEKRERCLLADGIISSMIATLRVPTSHGKTYSNVRQQCVKEKVNKNNRKT